MRIHRIRIAAAAAVTAATLSLTACQGSADGTRDEGRAPAPVTAAPSSSAPSASSAPEPAATATRTTEPAAATPAGSASRGTGTSPHGSTTPGGKNGKNGGNGGNGSGGNSGSSAGQDTAATDRSCTATTVRVVYSPVSRPLNHALLTVTNTGGTTCNAYYAPVLRFDEGQAAVAVDESSKPQAVATLAPGESAYAGITLSAADGSGSHGGPAKNLTVWFAPRDGAGSTGGPKVLKLPAGTYTDSSARVTYWQGSMDDALSF
ncbi:DUF4232 domain-containing protein [Streptomyces sp. NPDC001744]|uniref:DUF4232 domain-containing protein n=1 Tax=Streptomyces sp. NPDC001744 TaxID=3364606 RepID=UPI00369DBE9B